MSISFLLKSSLAKAFITCFLSIELLVYKCSIYVYLEESSCVNLSVASFWSEMYFSCSVMILRRDVISISFWVLNCPSARVISFVEDILTSNLLTYCSKASIFCLSSSSFLFDYDFYDTFCCLSSSTLRYKFCLISYVLSMSASSYF